MVYFHKSKDEEKAQSYLPRMSAFHHHDTIVCNFLFRSASQSPCIRIVFVHVVLTSLFSQVFLLYCCCHPSAFPFLSLNKSSLLLHVDELALRDIHVPISTLKSPGTREFVPFSISTRSM